MKMNTLVYICQKNSGLQIPIIYVIVYCLLSIDFHSEELSVVPCIINIVNTGEQITTFDLYSKMQNKVMVIENDPKPLRITGKSYQFIYIYFLSVIKSFLSVLGASCQF